ncbi:APC family permease [Acidianus sp. RZ1]|uniref:amino acid permease n=1 Tax=Acidianus sp. RZ1 TaxID=1540082 RepID=UPI001490A422|nr:APC family permease [Acidianus sp. RZ1]NON61268.1 APC family permease [Acidianus sp. RZ1]
MSKFLRESSGLVKDVSLRDLVMLNVANMGAGLAVFQGISPYIVKGGVLWISSLLTFLLSLPLVFVYTWLMMRIPRTGGDYIWLSRKLHSGLGSIMGVAIAFNMPPYFALSAFFSAVAINAVLSEIGALNHLGFLTYLANNVFVNPYNNVGLIHDMIIYVVAAVAFAIIIGVNIAKPRWGYSLTTVLGLISSAGLIIAMIVLAINIPDFHESISRFLSVCNLSSKPYTGPTFSLPATLYMIPYFASYAYIWLYAGPAVASEAKEGSLKYNLILGSIMTAIMITLPFFLMDIAGGYAFNASLYPTFTYNFWQVSIALSPLPLQVLLGITLIAWNFFIMAFGIIVFSRYIFAFSFDRLFPSIFAKLNKASSPIYAHLLDLLVTLGFLAIPIISVSGAESLYAYTPLAVAYLFLVSLTGIKVGKHDKDTKIIISGVISAIFMLFLGYESFTNPYFGVISSTGINMIGTGYIISLVGLGVITYILAKIVRREQGIDIDVVYKEIPPD